MVASSGDVVAVAVVKEVDGSDDVDVADDEPMEEQEQPFVVEVA